MWAEKYTENKMWKLMLFTLAPNPHEAVCPVSFRLRKFEETRNQPPDRLIERVPLSLAFPPNLPLSAAGGLPREQEPGERPLQLTPRAAALSV